MTIEQIGAWLGVLAVFLVAVERGVKIFNDWRHGRGDDKNETIDYATGLQKITDKAVQDKVELQQELLKQRDKIMTMEEKMGAVAFDVSYRVYVYSNRIERFTIKPVDEILPAITP